MWRAADIKKVTRIFVVSMSVADLGIGFFTLPVQLLSLVVDMTDTSQQSLCVVHVILYTLFSGTSLLNVLLITVERYVAIEFPFRHRSLVTVRRAYIAMASVWLICGANAAISGTLAGMTDFFHDELGICLSFSVNTTNHFEWLQVCAYLFIPLFTIVAIYTRILVLVRRHVVRQLTMVRLSSLPLASGRRANQPTKNGRHVCKSRSLALRRKSLCTFLMVVSVYVVTFIPASIVLILAITGRPVSTYVLEVAKFSVYCYSWLNVVVYSLRDKAFREAARTIFCRQ
ncbi:adenosine receptor A3-like [Acanthaster planci]|uniref:Adenosine receptor A3-like n=1 Tax=Acanthaster planci TaxID=133434 RepID=A0A8B7XSQ7_ACAPL|nr:adenosine receptor A3-like [Acanthaster planci]